MVLESGPSATDRNYWLVVTIFFFGYAGWFVYDGSIRYPEKNRKEAARHLHGLVEEPLNLGEIPSKGDFDQLEALGPTSPQQVREAFGEAINTQRDTSGATVEQFASLYGMATVNISDGRVRSMSWTAWAKSKEEIRGQYYWALIPLILGLYPLSKFYRAVTLRVLIDDQSMTYAGRRIPFESMTSLRDFNPKGWVDLYYKVAERELRLRIDNQKVAKFGEIVEAICQTKAFQNPVTAALAEEADEAEQRDDAPDADEPGDNKGCDTV
ncbi:MAG: hypothetical protein KKB50_05360 [Planctomycetes bacterium]|nr:hypothetical protein [Planctomycetota bacterium]